MRSNSLRLSLLLLVLFASIAPAAPFAKHVVIVSIDGLRPDVLSPELTPVIARMSRNGARAREARTTLPSVTLVSHASMLTGVGPKKHGVFWNTEEPQGERKAATILELAEKQGAHAEAVVNKKRFFHIIPKDGKNPIQLAGSTSKSAASAAAKALAEHRPALLFVHFADPDSVGHKHGWLSEEYLKACARSDASLGRLMHAIEEAGLARDTVVIVTADHGGKGKTHGPDTPECVLIPWIAHGPGVREGHEIQRTVMTYDTGATALWILGLARPDNLDGKPVIEAFGK